jgi:hypothetical protein
MVFYSSTGSAASGLTNNTTYFVEDFFASGTPNTWRLSLKTLPNVSIIPTISGGTGTQTLTRIGVSLDRNIIHIRNSNFTQYDMIEYAYPSGGHFGAPLDQIKDYYFVQTAYDAHNYLVWKERQDVLPVRMLLVGGGGSGGNALGGGGGGGGVVNVPTLNVTPGTLYPVTVGQGGSGQIDRFTNNKGTASTAFGATAAGGGSSGAHNVAPGTSGGCGGGESSIDEVVGSNRGGISTGNSLGTLTGTTHGFKGGSQTTRRTSTACRGAGGGGAGAAAADINVNSTNGSGAAGNNGSGGNGYQSDITGTNLYYAGGGGGGCYVGSGRGGAGGLGGGGGGASNDTTGGDGGGSAQNTGGNGPFGDNQRGGAGGANTGGGGGGGSWSADETGGFGGSGVIILRYSSANSIIIGSGLTATTTTVGADRVTRITAGSGNISWN